MCQGSCTGKQLLSGFTTAELAEELKSREEVVSGRISEDNEILLRTDTGAIFEDGPATVLVILD